MPIEESSLRLCMELAPDQDFSKSTGLLECAVMHRFGLAPCDNRIRYTSEKAEAAVMCCSVFQFLIYRLL